MNVLNWHQESFSSIILPLNNVINTAFEKLSKNALPSLIVEIHGGHMHVTVTKDMLVRNVQISTNAWTIIPVDQTLIVKILMDLMNVHVKLAFTKIEIGAPISTNAISQKPTHVPITLTAKILQVHTIVNVILDIQETHAWILMSVKKIRITAGMVEMFQYKKYVLNHLRSIKKVIFAMITKVHLHVPAILDMIWVVVVIVTTRTNVTEITHVHSTQLALILLDRMDVLVIQGT